MDKRLTRKQPIPNIKRRCHRCSGTGRARCPICNGTGEVVKGVDLNGNPQVTRCTGCFGSKSTRCTICSGEGFV